MLPPAQVKYIDDLMRADLLYWRDLWFGWLLLSTKLVVVGLILEGPELLHELFAIRGRVRIEKSGASLQESHIPDWVKIVALLGWLFIVGGVAGEWITDAVISDADSNIQGFNNALLAETTKEAGDAKTSAKTAREESTAAKTEADAARLSAGEGLARAHSAERSLAKAESDAGKAQTSASSALTFANDAKRVASDAKQKADSFEQGIASAEKEAADAKSEITDAVKQATDAISELNRLTAELNQLKASRSLTNIPALVSALKPFAGVEYAFSGINGDDESKDLADKISEVLMDAGWKPGLNPKVGFGNMWYKLAHFPPSAVPIAPSTGIHVDVEVEGDVGILNQLPVLLKPRHVQATIALKAALAASVWPPQPDLATTGFGTVPAGSSKAAPLILLTIGKKP